MKKMNKEVELSFKALGAAMFMATVCLYLAIGGLFFLLDRENFHYHISFAFLIQGLIASMAASVAWVVCFGEIKKMGFAARFIIPLAITLALFGLSALIPVINATQGFWLWLASGLVATVAFGTAIAVLSEKRLKKTGTRSVLLWEL
ncbi:MAG: hypothetical protein FWD06_07835 [Oscillospiraceae bacterium]|nr:hypothetical protein [Oscillospiraceae bacterium]